MRKVLKCGQLFSARDDSVQTDMAVVVDGNKIMEVLPASAVDTTNAEIVDLGDKFVMPGLIDAHVHISMIPGESLATYYATKLQSQMTVDSLVQAEADLMAGFTSVRDGGDYQYVSVGVRDGINAKKLKGPRILAAGPALNATGGNTDSHFNPTVSGQHTMAYICNSPDEMRAAARQNIKYGAEHIKLMATGGVMSRGTDPNAADFTVEEMKAAVEVADEKGLTVMTHAHGTGGIRNAVLAGTTTIEHGMLMDESSIELMEKHGTYLTPTIIAAYRIAEAKGKLPDWMIEKASKVLENFRENLGKCRKAGIKICFGTDAGTPFSYHGQQTFEFELMEQFGFTPLETLVAATRTNATMMKWIDKLGTIESGKLADIVAFSQSPLENIKTMGDVRFIMQDGDIVKPV